MKFSNNLDRNDKEANKEDTQLSYISNHNSAVDNSFPGSENLHLTTLKEQSCVKVSHVLSPHDNERKRSPLTFSRDIQQDKDKINK